MMTGMASFIHHQVTCVHSALSNSINIPDQTTCSDTYEYTMSTKIGIILYYEKSWPNGLKVAVEDDGED
jgi:hypothetical protein